MSVSKKRVNRHMLSKMRLIYYPKGAPYIDWMGYPITAENLRSYHHIVKKEDLKKQNLSEKATIENGAYLGKKSHELLHRVEQVDPELYEMWNYVFLIINRMGCYPIPDVWEMVYSLQRQTEELFKEDPKVLRKLRKEAAKK